MRKDFKLTYDLGAVYEADGLMNICHALMTDLMNNNDYYIKSICGHVSSLNQAVFDCTLVNIDQYILLRLSDKQLSVVFTNCREEELNEIVDYIESELHFWEVEEMKIVREDNDDLE